MYSLFRLLSLKEVLVQQAPALGTSLLVAEVFYKFHSFTLECIAFLATWFAVDAALQFITGLARRRL